MGRLVWLLTLIAVLRACTAHAAGDTPDPCPEPTPVAECYRRAAEAFRGRWLESEARRKALAADLEDTTASRDRWRDAAQTAAEPVTPAWVWPTAAGVAIAFFIGGFVLAAEYSR